MKGYNSTKITNRNIYWIFKYLWLIAILPKSAQFVFLAFLVACVAIPSLKKNGFKIDKLSGALLVVNCIYLLSIIINAMTGNHEQTRILAALNACLITFIALLAYNIFLKVEFDFEIVKKYMYYNFIILFLLYFLYLLLGTKGNVSFLNPLCGPDWLSSGYELRFKAYMEYTNLVVFMYLYCAPFAFMYVFEKWPRIWANLFQIASFFIVLGTNSRIGIVTCFIAIASSILFVNKKGVTSFYQRNKIGFWVLAIAIVLILIVVFWKPFINLMNQVLYKRTGSTSTRMRIYSLSLTKMLEQSPVIGCGIKDMLGKYPYGSHSTYIGMYYKVGILGGSLFLIAFIYTTIKLMRNKANTGLLFLQKVSLLCLIASFLFEDLDGANWNIVLFYIILAIQFQ